MAYTVTAQFSATIRDSWGIESSTNAEIEYDGTATVATLMNYLNSWENALDACTDGQLVKGSVRLFALPNTIKGAPVAGARIQQTGLLGFLPTGSMRRYSFSIPALSNDPGVLNGDRIVLTHAGPIDTLVGLFTTAPSEIAYTNEVGQQIATFVDALVSFRKDRKQLQRASFERP